MPANLLQPFGQIIYSSVTKTATFTGATVKNIPMGESYQFILDLTAIAGTATTLDAALQTAVIDAKGTPANWYTFARFAQMTSVSTRRLVMQNTQGRGEAASEAQIANTGGALAQNCPFTSAIRMVFTIGGSGGAVSTTFAVYMIVTPKVSAVI